MASPEFALSVVCLIKGRAEHAVVICPFSDDEYLASRGRGAQLNGKRLRVSKIKSAAGARLSLGLPDTYLRSRFLPTYLTLVQQLGPQAEQLQSSACGLLDMARLAAGRADAAFVLGVEEQDLDIGSLLLKESGALIGTPDGQPSVRIEGALMAANPRLFKALIKQLAPHVHTAPSQPEED